MSTIKLIYCNYSKIDIITLVGRNMDVVERYEASCSRTSFTLSHSIRCIIGKTLMLLVEDIISIDDEQKDN